VVSERESVFSKLQDCGAGDVWGRLNLYPYWKWESSRKAGGSPFRRVFAHEPLICDGLLGDYVKG
jgi:hypothetical protein